MTFRTWLCEVFLSPLLKFSYNSKLGYWSWASVISKSWAVDRSVFFMDEPPESLSNPKLSALNPCTYKSYMNSIGYICAYNNYNYAKRRQLWGHRSWNEKRNRKNVNIVLIYESLSPNYLTMYATMLARAIQISIDGFDFSAENIINSKLVLAVRLHCLISPY